jgi:hypothetical protein
MSYTVFLFLQMFTHRNYKALYGPHISMRGQIQFLKKSWLSFSTNHLHRKSMISILPWLLIAVHCSKNEEPVIRWHTTPGRMRWTSHTLIGTQVCFCIMHTLFFHNQLLLFGLWLIFESQCFPFVNIFVLLIANFLGKGFFNDVYCVNTVALRETSLCHSF